MRCVVMLFVLFVGSTVSAGELTGVIVDAETGATLPGRVYLQSADGEWLFVKSASPDGSALPYTEQWVPTPEAVELHTTVSAHPFRADLNPGRYEITIVHGKEYFPSTESITVGDTELSRTFRLKRWVNLAERGWYSGETHVHRRIQELPNVMRAEDLNVAFPVTFWTTQAFTAPGVEPSPLRRQGPSPFGPREDRGFKAIDVDDTHVIFPRNTEYEVFSVGEKRHVQGAMFLLNHRTRFSAGAPPIKAIAEQAHAEGALLDLDKHNWPWSMMLIPVAKVDLYELSNNSVWRTNFGFKRSGTEIPAYAQIETNEQGALSEEAWLRFGWENYYALLNCGFPLRPTAGTASGVHPVPLGHSRVYVYVDGEFSGEKWFRGLGAGESFVSTGPMLLLKVDGRHPGHTFEQAAGSSVTYRVTGEAISPTPLESVELLVNGKVVKTIDPQPERTKAGAYRSAVDETIAVDSTSWIAARCISRQADERMRFAHTGPVFVQVGDEPHRPRKEQIAFLIRRVKNEIERNEGILPDEALEEFREALAVYERIAKRAR